MKHAVPIAFALMFALHVPATRAQSAPPRKDIPAIAKTANGAIVSIVMSKGGRPFAQGSGFIVNQDGVIVTNYHVISEGNSAIVKFPDGAEFAVDGVVASDKARDVAVIKTHGRTFRTLSLGNSDRLQVGEEVVAIGNPLSLESTVSNGIVSAIRVVKEKGQFLQITAPISHGSSGGPLFNMAGEVVGITAGFFEGGENLNFAIPINEAKRLLSNKLAKLQNLPDEPLKDDAGDLKPAVPKTPPEQHWLSSERYSTPEFSALYPSGKPGDPNVYCIHSTEKEYTTTICGRETEGGGVSTSVAFVDFLTEPSGSLEKALYASIHQGDLVNPIELSTNLPASINQDQSFAAVRPIVALESTAKGMFNGAPVKACFRLGRQGRRAWFLIVMVADSTGHTQKEAEAFFDSVIVK